MQIGAYRFGFKNRWLMISSLLCALVLVCACADNNALGSERNSPLVPSPLQETSLNFTSGIRAVLHDSYGNYWFGSHNEGLCLFDGAMFRYFTTSDGLPDNQVRTIQEDAQHNIWFGTANGVAVYDGIQLKKVESVSSIPSKNWQYASTDLWFNAGEKEGVFRWDGKELNYYESPKSENRIPYDFYAMTGVSRSKNGTTWIATYAALWKADEDGISMIDKELGLLETDENLHIRSVLADSKGRVWVGNNGIGVLLMDGDSLYNFTKSQGLMHSNSGKSGGPSPEGTLEHVFAISEDKSGNIWFGDRDTGAWKYDGETMTNYTVDANLSSQMIWHIYQDPNGDVLFAMADGAVYRFVKDGFERVF